MLERLGVEGVDLVAGELTPPSDVNRHGPYPDGSAAPAVG